MIKISILHLKYTHKKKIVFTFALIENQARFKPWAIINDNTDKKTY